VSKRSFFINLDLIAGCEPPGPLLPLTFTPDSEYCVGVLTNYHKITNLLRFRVKGHQSSTPYTYSRQDERPVT